MGVKKPGCPNKPRVGARIQPGQFDQLLWRRFSDELKGLLLQQLCWSGIRHCWSRAPWRQREEARSHKTDPASERCWERFFLVIKKQQTKITPCGYGCIWFYPKKETGTFPRFFEEPLKCHHTRYVFRNKKDPEGSFFGSNVLHFLRLQLP